MKKVILLALIAIAMPSMAQKYKVHGVAPADVKVVYMYHNEGSRLSAPDSVVLGADRTFVFSGENATGLFAVLRTDREVFDNIALFLDGDITVDFNTRKVTGTAENVALSKAYEEIFPLRMEQTAINKEAEAMQAAGTLNHETVIPLRERYEKASDAIVEKVSEICENNQQMLFPAYLLRNNYYMMSHSDIIRWYDNGAAFMKDSILGSIKERIDGWRRQEPGNMFTDIEENDTLGVSHKLSEYVGTGNYVLVDFWASWCGPCVQEMPNVKEAYEKYHAKGFDVVGLSFDNDKSAWIEAINRLGLPWHHLSDLKGWETVASETYGISSIPSTLLVGPDGKIIDNSLRGEALKKKLAEIFGF